MSLPPHLAQMGMRYPMEVLVSGAGRRVIYKDFWNHGLKKNMPQHFKVSVIIKSSCHLPLILILLLGLS